MLSLPDVLSGNVTPEGYQKHQLQQKRPRDIEFFDENGNPVKYKDQHEDIPHDTCNDLYPIHRQQGIDGKKLRLQNDGGSSTLNSISNEFLTLSALSATDGFRMGNTINQFRRLCYPLSYSPFSKDNFDPTYSSVSFLD